MRLSVSCRWTAASSPWLGKDTESRQGLALSHAYSVLKAVEEVGEDDKKVQLVLIRWVISKCPRTHFSNDRANTFAVIPGENGPGTVWANGAALGATAPKNGLPTG